jgi:cytochrome c biogenesis protein CcmG, thiol:disulfide interchange protein DsbE
MTGRPSPPPAPARRGWRRFLTVPGLLLAAVWVWLLIRLGPHLGAVVGIDTGDGTRPAYAYPDLGGGVIASDGLRGKVVLVNVWATWCPPCRVEMPLLQAMYERHRERGLVVVGLSVDTAPPDAIRQWLADRGVTYPVAVVGDGALEAFGGVAGYPTSFLLDREGRIRHRALGPLAMASFEPAVRRLLAAPRNPAGPSP